MNKIKISGLIFTFFLVFLNNKIQASISYQINDEISSETRISIVHNPNCEEFKAIIPLYQKYYNQRQNKTEDEILKSYKEVIKLPGFNFIAAFDTYKNTYVGFINFGHAPDQFLSPKYKYRTILDSIYIENTQEEFKIYKILFGSAEKVSRDIGSHRMIAKVGADDFGQEKRLYSSNMESFSSLEKEKSMYYEFHLDK